MTGTCLWAWVLLVVLFSVGGGGGPVGWSVGSVVIVFGSPVVDDDAGFERVSGVFAVGAFVAGSAIERLGVAVVPRC